MNLKRTVAREWLYFMGCIFAGLLLAIATKPGEGGWIVLVLPYIFFQFARSMIWASRTLRRTP